MSTEKLNHGVLVVATIMAITCIILFNLCLILNERVRAADALVEIIEETCRP